MAISIEIQAKYQELTECRAELLRTENLLTQIDRNEDPAGFKKIANQCQVLRDKYISIEEEVARTNRRFAETAATLMDLESRGGKSLDTTKKQFEALTDAITLQKMALESADAQAREYKKHAAEALAQGRWEDARKFNNKATAIEVSMESEYKKMEGLNSARADLVGKNQARSPLSDIFDGVQTSAKGVTQAQEQVAQGNANVARSFSELSTADQVFDRLSYDIQRVGSYMGIYFGEQFVNKLMQTRGQFQQLEQSFKTMLGSADGASKLMEQLTRTAATTPFDLQGVASSAKQLMAYGTRAEEVNDTLIKLGDIAAGVGSNLSDVAYLYGTTMVQGRMYTMDLRQFQGRGIPIAEEIAKVFQEKGENVTKSQVQDLVSQGKVTADVFQKALFNMSSEGGKFSGLMEAQSKTINGALSNLQDNVDMMFNNIAKDTEIAGKPMDEWISKGIRGAGDLVENYKKVIDVLEGLAITYGAVKATEWASDAFGKGAIKTALQSEIRHDDAEIKLRTARMSDKEKIALEENARNALGITDANIGVGVHADLGNIENLDALQKENELRKEILNQLDLQQQFQDSLNRMQDIQAERLEGIHDLFKDNGIEMFDAETLEKVTKMSPDEIANSVDAEELQKYADAYEQLDEKQKQFIDNKLLEIEVDKSSLESIEDEIEGYKEQLDELGELLSAAEDEGDTEQANTIIKQRATVQQKLQTAEEQRGNIQRSISTKQTQLNTTAQVQNTAATVSGTVAEKARIAWSAISTTATKLASAAYRELAIAVQTATAAMMANPITTVIALLGMAYTAYQMFASDEAEAPTKMSEEFGESLDKQAGKLDTLVSVLKNTAQGSQAHKKAIDELNEVSKQYHLTELEEVATMDEIIARKEKLIGLIRDEAMETAKANAIKTLEEDLNTNDDSIKDNITDMLKDSGMDAHKVKFVANAIMADLKEVQRTMAETTDPEERLKALQSFSERAKKITAEAGGNGNIWNTEVSGFHNANLSSFAVDDNGLFGEKMFVATNMGARKLFGNVLDPIEGYQTGMEAINQIYDAEKASHGNESISAKKEQLITEMKNLADEYSNGTKEWKDYERERKVLEERFNKIKEEENAQIERDNTQRKKVSDWVVPSAPSYQTEQEGRLQTTKTDVANMRNAVGMMDVEGGAENIVAQSMALKEQITNALLKNKDGLKIPIELQGDVAELGRLKEEMAKAVKEGRPTIEIESNADRVYKGIITKATQLKKRGNVFLDWSVSQVDETINEEIEASKTQKEMVDNLVRSYEDLAKVQDKMKSGAYNKESYDKFHKEVEQNKELVKREADADYYQKQAEFAYNAMSSATDAELRDQYTKQYEEFTKKAEEASKSVEEYMDTLYKELHPDEDIPWHIDLTTAEGKAKEELIGDAMKVRDQIAQNFLNSKIDIPLELWDVKKKLKDVTEQFNEVKDLAKDDPIRVEVESNYNTVFTELMNKLAELKKKGNTTLNWLVNTTYQQSNTPTQDPRAGDKNWQLIGGTLNSYKWVGSQETLQQYKAEGKIDEDEFTKALQDLKTAAPKETYDQQIGRAKETRHQWAGVMREANSQNGTRYVNEEGTQLLRKEGDKFYTVEGKEYTGNARTDITDKNQVKTIIENTQKTLNDLKKIEDSADQTDYQNKLVASTQASQAAREERFKNTRDRQREAEDRNFKLAETQVDAMKDGERQYIKLLEGVFDKITAKRLLAQKKDSLNLERQWENDVEKELSRREKEFNNQQAIRKAGDAVNGDKTVNAVFNKDAVRKQIEEEFRMNRHGEAQKLALKEKYATENEKAEREEKQKREKALTDFLKTYGDTEAQKLAVTKEYAEKIRKAQESGNTFEVAKLRKDMQKEIDKLNIDGFKKKWEDVFDYLEGATKESMQLMVNELQRALRKGLVPKDEIANVQAQIAKLDAQIKTYVPNGKMGGTFWQKLIGSDTTTTREARARIIETEENRENAESRVKEKRAELEGKQEDVQSNISRLSELLLGSVGEGKRRYDENTVVIAELSEKQENGTISPDEYNELERARTENQDLEQNNEIVKLTSVIAKNNELIATKRAERDANNAAINENQTRLETETNLSEEERAALMAAIDLLNAQNQDIETAISTLERDNVEQYATLTTSANSLVTEQMNSNIGTMEQQQEEVSALEDKVSKGEATDEERAKLNELKDSNQSLIDANKTLESTLQELIASMMGVETSNKELVDAEQESSKATKDDIKAKKDGANATKGQKKIDAKGGLDMAQQAVDGAAGLMSKMGIESEGATAAMGIMSGAMDTAAKFMEGDFVGAAMSAISTLLDIGSLFGGISDANYVEDMEKLTTSNEVLRDSIDKLSEKMDKQSAVEANKTYEQQKVMFNESLKNTREQLKRTYEVSSSAWFSGYHSVAYNIDRNMDQSTKDLFNKYFGGVGAMFDADYEKVSDILTQNSAMLSGLRNAAKDSEWGEDFLGYVDEFLAYSDQWNKIEKNRQQTILGFSFDSLSQNFRDNLKNMESATTNWGKSTADRLREMQIKQYTTTEDYQKKRDAIDNKYLEYIKDDKLTRAEVQDILTQEKKLASELNAQVRNWEDETGIDREYDDTASSRSLKGMSEDTANELNGRFTAMQISLQQQVVNQATLLANVTSINSVLYQCNAALEGIATQQALATQHLEDINERQKKYYIDFANYMEKIEQNTDRL